MLGAELCSLLEKEGIPFITSGRELDIRDKTALLRFAEQHSHIKWLVNCAAYTAVEKAEEEQELCRSINTDGVAHIAETAASLGAVLIHLSTDYVFNGKAKNPYKEDDPSDPIGVYGITKRHGEECAFQKNPSTYIVRTAWLYGKNGKNFVQTMLKRMSEQNELNVVNDQRGSPTWAADLSRTILSFIRPGDKKYIPYGIYHYTNEGSCTWFEFAVAIYHIAKECALLKKDCLINPCSSEEFPSKVKRPAYSVMDKEKIKMALSLQIPDWRSSLKEYLYQCVR
jgi:dTDP-4-dehydrorhamnose reductase